jgi:hypothetical protein
MRRDREGVPFFVIASEAKQSMVQQERVDCFASLAMTVAREAPDSQPSSSAIRSGLLAGRTTGSGGRSSIPETPMIEPKGRGVLDPRFRGDDDCE